MKELFDGNLIYLETYKRVIAMKKGLVFFKNSYFRMSPEAREKEKAAIEAALLVNEFDIQAILKKKIIEEVENG